VQGVRGDPAIPIEADMRFAVAAVTRLVALRSSGIDGRGKITEAAMLRLGLMRFVFLAALLAAVSPSLADSASPVRALMEETGLIAQSGGSEEWISNQILEAARSFPELDPASVAYLREISAKAVGKERILADTEKGLTLILVPPQIDSLRTFYRSPLGQSVLRAEIAGATPEISKEINEDDGSLRAQARKEVERTEIFRRMDDVFLASMQSARLFAAIDILVVSALARTRFHGEVPPGVEAFIARQGVTLRGDLLKTMRAQTLASFTRIYRDLSTAELRSYLDYLESGIPSEFYAALAAVSARILDERMGEINAEFATYARLQRT